MFNEGGVGLDLSCVSSHLPQQGRPQQEPVRCKISQERGAGAMQLQTPAAFTHPCIGRESLVAWSRFWLFCMPPSAQHLNFPPQSHGQQRQCCYRVLLPTLYLGRASRAHLPVWIWVLWGQSLQLPTAFTARQQHLSGTGHC